MTKMESEACQTTTDGGTLSLFTATCHAGRIQLQWCIPKGLYKRPVRHKVVPQLPQYDTFRIWCASWDHEYSRDPYQPRAGANMPEDSQLVHEGPLTPQFGRRFAWTSELMEIGRCYAFYVACAGGPVAGPAIVKVRDPEVWWTCEETRRRITRFVERCPVPVERHIVGSSRMGRDIEALFLGAGSRTVVLAAAVHPGESGPELLLGMLEKMTRARPDLFTGFQVIVVPCVNPDSRERLAHGHPVYLRTNAAGVDLNRNFDDNWSLVSEAYGERSDEPASETWRGPEAFSEPESRALRDLCESHPPAAVIAYHWMGGISAPPMNHHLGIYSWDDWDQRNVPYEQRCKQAANAYGCAYYKTPDPEPWYPHPSIQPGSFEGWVAMRFGTPGYAMEGGRDEDSRLGQRDAVTPTVLQAHAERHSHGLAAFLDYIRDLPASP